MTNEEKNRKKECWQIFDPEKAGYSWFNPNDMVESMQKALIVRLSRHIVGCEWPEEALELQEFMVHILSRKPYRTKSKNIHGLVAAAAQMVIRSSWEERQKLINIFLDFVD